MNREGKHYYHDGLSFWAEDGLIYIEDHRNGDFNVVTCRDFFARAVAMNEEAKLCLLPSDQLSLNTWVLKMHEAWKEAKFQGDPMDPKIAHQKYKERRKVSMITGMW